MNNGDIGELVNNLQTMNKKAINDATNVQLEVEAPISSNSTSSEVRKTNATQILAQISTPDSQDMMQNNIEMVQQREAINQFAWSQAQQQTTVDAYGQPSSVEYQ